jgi:hypothetical protein
MKRNTTHLLAGFIIAAPLAGLMGCEAQRKEDIPAGAQPQPVGSSVRDHFGRQAAKAEQDDFVVYNYEWDGESTRLTRNGARRFGSVAPRLASEPFDFIIEPSADERLDDARRRALVTLVARQGIPNADDRVVVAYPSAEGLFGDEAPRIYDGVIQRSDSAGGGAGGRTVSRSSR